MPLHERGELLGLACRSTDRRAALARLIIPYVRVAMLDRRMFMQSSHPARRVLNLLVEAFETASPEVGNYRSLREQAFGIVDRISNEFDDDVKRAREAGFDEHLTKPVDLDLLMAKISGCIMRLENNRKMGRGL